MLKAKRRARSSDESPKVHKRRVKEVSRISSDLGEGMTENLNQELAEKLSLSIISLASFVGDKKHCSCTGIVIEERPYGIRILTSSNLFTTTDKHEAILPPPRIKVCLPNNEIVTGRVKHLNSRWAVVTTSFYPYLRAARLDNIMQVDSCTKAIKRCFTSGKLMASSGVVTDCPTGVGYDGFMLSTCKITQDGSGGPLVDFDGNIVGMNEYLDGGMTRYIPTKQIIEDLKNNGLWEYRGVAPLRMTRCPEGSSSALQVTSDDSTSESDEEKELDEPRGPEYTEDKRKHLRIVDPWSSDDFTAEVNRSLESDGYPLPKYADGGMCLEGDFEEGFSVNNLRKKTRKQIALKSSQSVVALASFNDKGRYFACTGVLIDCDRSIRVLTSANLVRNGNKIEKNLRIEVRLPNKGCKAGTLQHCSLQHNVATVSIIDFGNNRAAKFTEKPQTKVVALGRVFKSGNFMATRGVVTGKQSRFDCKELKVSNCKITKAGIGGPLVDFNGDIVGMNFYDTEETPYLPSNIILKVLRQFGLKGTVATGNTEEEEEPRDSWPVPDPYWYYPSLHRERHAPVSCFL